MTVTAEETSFPAAVFEIVESELDSKILENALLMARISDDFKGEDTLLLDMRTTTPIVDYFVITTANSNRQMRGISEEVRRIMKLRGIRAIGTEGEDVASMWMLYDFGDYVLHVFTPEGRALYRLEDLWCNAPRVNWHEPGRAVAEDQSSAEDLSSAETE